MEALPDGQIRVLAEGTLDRSELIAAIGRRTGARTVVDRDLGEIDAASLGSASPASLVLRIAEDNSVVLVHEGGRLVSILVLASADEVLSKPPPLRIPPADVAPLPAGTEAAIRGIGIREVIELSNRRDPAARLELERLSSVAEDARVRAAALSALASMLGPRAVPRIEHALDDPDPDIRIKAAYALAVAIGDEASERLGLIAEFDRAPKVRTAIAQLLEDAGGDHLDHSLANQ